MEFIYRQGTADGHWYYARASEWTSAHAWTGPFISRAAAVRHSQGDKTEPNYD